MNFDQVHRVPRVNKFMRGESCSLDNDVFGDVVLQYIPMPVLFGVFLFMGTSSLKGIQVSVINIPASAHTVMQ